MVIYLKNSCGSWIDACFNNTKSIAIGPYENKRLVLQNVKDFTLLICLRKKNSVKDNIYNLILESKYVFCNVSDDIDLSITREKIRVSLNVSYERVFVNTSRGCIASETTSVKDENNIKKRYERDRFCELLYGPLEHFPGLSLVMFIVGIFLAWLTDWRWIFLYYPFAYACLFVLHWLVDVFWNSFIKKTLKMDRREEFYRSFELDYILQYYSQINREPFMGQVDRE